MVLLGFEGLIDVVAWIGENARLCMGVVVRRGKGLVGTCGNPLRR